MRAFGSVSASQWLASLPLSSLLVTSVCLFSLSAVSLGLSSLPGTCMMLCVEPCSLLRESPATTRSCLPCLSTRPTMSKVHTLEKQEGQGCLSFVSWCQSLCLCCCRKIHFQNLSSRSRLTETYRCHCRRHLLLSLIGHSTCLLSLRSFAWIRSPFTHAHTRTHTRTQTHIQYTRTRARAHTHTHTHTHKINQPISIAVHKL